MVTDPIADYLTRIRNSQMANHRLVEIPASNLKAGTNDVLIIGGSGSAVSAIRATQIQLKYLWDKTDYQLQTDR